MKEASRQRPAFSILICSDSFLLKKEIADLLARYPAAGKDWRRILFWGDDEPDAKFWDSLRQTSLFAESRVVILRNAQEWKADSWRLLSDAIAQVPAFIWPVICLEGEFEKGKAKIPAHIDRTKCFQFAKRKDWLWIRPPLEGSGLNSYVRNQARARGLKFAGNAFSLFCESVPADAGSIENLLEILTLASTDGVIDENMAVHEAANSEYNAFLCVRCMQRGDMAGVWKEIEGANANELLFFMIAILARELRILWQMLNGVEVRIPDAQFKRQIAERIGLSGISGGFCALADAEWQVKSGQRTPNQALETLVARMIETFGAASARKFSPAGKNWASAHNTTHS